MNTDTISSYTVFFLNEVALKVLGGGMGWILKAQALEVERLEFKSNLCYFITM